MIKISVSASRNYDVIMERGALARAGEYVKAALKLHAASEAAATRNTDSAKGSLLSKKLCIITDTNVNQLYGQREHALWRSLTEAGFDIYKFVFPGGEVHKNMATIAEILGFLADNHFSRSDVLLALGGGITGDVTGFAAATYLRGVEFIQMPTSLLAVVDSSVGGKTGVNLSAGKNLAGAFWQPSLVLFDPDVLKTLSNDLKLDGIAEAVKAGVIDDSHILRMIEAHYAPDLMKPDCANSLMDTSILQSLLDNTAFLNELAARAVEVKRRIVEKDERESGPRQLLNLGHTLAHAIEKCSSYEISHGHAVAMGMDMVSAAADQLGWSEEQCHPQIHNVLKGFGFPLACPYTPKELTAATLQDKKIRGSEITLVIPAAIGNCGLKTIPIAELETFITCGLANT